MNKLLVSVLATFVASLAQAQNPSGTTPEQGNATNSASQKRAQARSDARQHGAVAPPAGDVAATPEGGSFGTDKAGVAGEERAETRDQRRRNKDGSLKRRSTQGDTPK
ncbi:cell envelope biogenesis protein TolA [Variovorax sp. GB1R11]|uniref:cell envelope biogenesis protein TolA n=1 Tax=Variovorax sp. GB1R11 TaxID=3443741 RepID=UPI003F465633